MMPESWRSALSSRFLGRNRAKNPPKSADLKFSSRVVFDGFGACLKSLHFLSIIGTVLRLLVMPWRGDALAGV
jgi:hypothetical protein